MGPHRCWIDPHAVGDAEQRATQRASRPDSQNSKINSLFVENLSLYFYFFLFLPEFSKNFQNGERPRAPMVWYSARSRQFFCVFPGFCFAICTFSICTLQRRKFIFENKKEKKWHRTCSLFGWWFFFFCFYTRIGNFSLLSTFTATSSF